MLEGLVRLADLGYFLVKDISSAFGNKVGNEDLSLTGFTFVTGDDGKYPVKPLLIRLLL